MRPVLRLFDLLCLALAWLSGLIAAFVMTVTFVGVVMRYLLRKPLMGGFEMIEIGMGLLVFSALPWMVRQGGNIRVTILSDRFSPGIARIAEVFTQLIGSLVLALIAWRIWLQGTRLLTYNEVTMELRVPKGLIAQSMSVLMAVAALAFLVCALEALLRTQRPAEPGKGLH